MKSGNGVVAPLGFHTVCTAGFGSGGKKCVECIIQTTCYWTEFVHHKDNFNSSRETERGRPPCGVMTKRSITFLSSFPS
jgi:hypothetical protein